MFLLLALFITTGLALNCTNEFVVNSKDHASKVCLPMIPINDGFCFQTYVDRQVPGGGINHDRNFCHIVQADGMWCLQTNQQADNTMMLCGARCCLIDTNYQNETADNPIIISNADKVIPSISIVGAVILFLQKIFDN